MKQMSFADAEYAGKRKQTRRERFLIEMDQVVPWKGLIALIEPYYPKGEGGRPAYSLMAQPAGKTRAGRWNFAGHQRLSGRPWFAAVPRHGGRCDDHPCAQFDQEQGG